MSAKIKKKGSKSDYEKYRNLSFSPHKQLKKMSWLQTADQTLTTKIYKLKSHFIGAKNM